MNYINRLLVLVFIVGIMLSASSCMVPKAYRQMSGHGVGYLDYRQEMLDKVDQFELVEIGVPAEDIPEEHRPLLKKLYEPAQIMDQLFLIQVAAKNPKWRRQIASNLALASTLAYFDIMYGPWDRIDNNQPFWRSKPKPKGATFYDRGLTKAEIEAWIEAYPDQKEAFTGFFTHIQKDVRGGLVAVPYSEVYELEEAAQQLEEAADLAVDERMARYLRSKAQAFRDNEYRQSDIDWMDLGDGDLEIVIGPVEAYEDQLFGYKASFQALICLRDPAMSEELSQIKGLIPEMEQALPIPDEYKTIERGSESPIAVVNLLYTSGFARASQQILAFNLPNDEYVRRVKGSKKVLLRNVNQAKYEKIMIPIAGQMMSLEQADRLSFDAFLLMVLLHEVGHGLGPGIIPKFREGDGTHSVQTTVKDELKDRYLPIEEAKAKTLGVTLGLFLIDEKGMYPEEMREELYAALLGSVYRSVRFGVGGAHSTASAIQLNYLIEQEALVRNADGQYEYVSEKMSAALESLLHELLMIEARGDYTAAGKFIERYGVLPDDITQDLAALEGVPIDIRPIYPFEQQTATW